MISRFFYVFKLLGPGILFASTAIGVSHLVQSTRAGAQFGFALIGFVLMANIFKYPFFEFGSRYASAKGESLIKAYKKQGKWVLFLYFLITLGSMFTVVAAVSFVCSGLISELFDSQMSVIKISAVLFVVCIAILISGKYSLLENFVKIISIILLLSTLLAFFFALENGPVESISGFIPKDIWGEKTSILFIIALMGWMPTAVDLSTWNSIWTVERIKSSKVKPTAKEILLDFNIGYIFTILLSICFITLGAYLIYGTGERMPDSSSKFATQLISLYTQTLGDWSYWIIAICAFSVMFSTTLAVFDGYARSMEETSELLFNIKNSYKIYLLWLFITGIGGYIIIYFFQNNFKRLIDLATTISFLIAPFCAILNHKIIHSEEIPISFRPPFWLTFLSYLGIGFLICFSSIFIYYSYYL